jgi:mannose/cellobiose epimerase-like protein (N-acyl-D-glucosamine 2-epimerase family)
MALNSYYQSLTVAGTVIAVDRAKPAFSVQARSGDVFEAIVGPTTYYEILSNLDLLRRDRIPDPDANRDADPICYNLQKYIHIGRPIFVSGIYHENGQQQRYEARTVYLLHSDPDRYVFEETHWWMVQVMQMADRILDHLFDAKRNYSIDDFSRFYRTQLNILGQQTGETVQECAVLSRLIYDLSSAYLMTGAERYFLAARAAVAYLRGAFRSLSNEGEHCFWAYGRRRNMEGEKGETLIFASRGPDDVGTIPLYEQIYAIAGLTQFYRITLDWEVLEDIRRTINTFQAFFWDPPTAKEEKDFPGTGGYYSHLDPVTMRPDTLALGENRLRKNWNSIGDHIPAYLVNLILSLDPLPEGEARPMLQKMLEQGVGILEETSALIIEKFPDAQSDYVNERFHADWRPDQAYKWQLDRAVVGHNLKIAWNLTRCAFYFQTRAKRLHDSGQGQGAAAYEQRSNRCLDLARRLADRMGEVGLDKIRGGIFDCVERQPQGGMPTQFTWGATKDFWQQEQGILAYLILHGATANDRKYLQLARESSAFWNLFFLDRERQGYFFRVTENGLPITEGQYGQKSSHAIGYHAFELAYLAHVYMRTFVAGGGGSDNSFCLYFKVQENPNQTSINVLPDFMPPGKIAIGRIRANGIDVTDQRKPANADDFKVSLKDLKGSGTDRMIELVVELRGLAPDGVSRSH